MSVYRNKKKIIIKNEMVEYLRNNLIHKKKQIKRKL